MKKTTLTDFMQRALNAFRPDGTGTMPLDGVDQDAIAAGIMLAQYMNESPQARADFKAWRVAKREVPQ